MTNHQIDYSRREARIRLAVKCNYKCFFCHEEGGCGGTKAEWDTLRPLLLDLKAQGRTDLTFTGGEPLLNKPVLLKALEEIASWEVQPSVTIITNAALMDDKVIAALEACDRPCVHVSVHDTRTAQYQEITGQYLRTAEQLRPLLCRLNAGGIKVKLNAVLTHEFMEEDFDDFLAFAESVGADAVKLVELLPTANAGTWRKRPISAAEVDSELEARGYPAFRRVPRTTYHRTPKGVVVEVTRCACALGCRHCAETRGDFFTGGTLYHPCFMDTKAIPLAGRSLEDVLAEGDAFIEEYISRHDAAVAA